jgi:hypothetical protein
MSQETVTATNGVEALSPKATLPEVIAKMNEIVEKVNNIKVRDRGPKSERSMTREDAWKVKFGPLKEATHKAAAKELGLSYGQVYSARGDYTFNDVKAGDFTTS